MTRYVSTDHDECSYITAGKRYVMLSADGDSLGGWITADNGQKIYILFDQCVHIDEHQWSIHEGHDEHTPKTWGEMTDAEKERSATMEAIDYIDEVFDSKLAQRIRDELGIKPEPKRKTVTLYGGGNLKRAWATISNEHDTHRLSFDTLNDEPICGTFTNENGDSIRMEKIEEDRA